MPRNYSVERQSFDQLTSLFPREIISRLDDFVANIPVDLARPIPEPGPIEQQLEVLDGVLDHIESRLNKEPEHKICALSDIQKSYLAYWVLEARRKAYSLLETQADTPLGFQPGVRGFLSNLFLASWIDLTQGGTVAVQWENIR